MFSDMHAYYQWANFYGDLADLDKVDWGLLQARDFKRDPEDPAKFERYQAEALVHQHLAIDGLLGVVCYTDDTRLDIEREIRARNLTLPAYARAGWHFQ